MIARAFGLLDGFVDGGVRRNPIEPKNLVEAEAQITGTAGARQVPDVNVAVAHGNGGVLSSQATVILGSGATL